jgi:HEPN domain-containing protein
MDPSDPNEWLRHARSNLARAGEAPTRPEILLANLCFDAQQAAEKAIKAVLVQRAVEFPKTHNVGELLYLVASAGIEIPESVALAKRLTLYAVGARYPRLEDDVTPEEWRVAAASAEAVVRWAERVIAEERSSPSG